MRLAVDTVFVWVSELERSVAWYQELGIEAGARHGDWQTMELDGPTRFALHQGTREPGSSTAVVSFGVDDIAAARARLAGSDIRPIEAEVTDTGVAMYLTFRDPDQNEIQLIERYG